MAVPMLLSLPCALCLCSADFGLFLNYPRPPMSSPPPPLVHPPPWGGGASLPSSKKKRVAAILHRIVPP